MEGNFINTGIIDQVIRLMGAAQLKQRVALKKYENVRIPRSQLSLFSGASRAPVILRNPIKRRVAV